MTDACDEIGWPRDSLSAAQENVSNAVQSLVQSLVMQNSDEDGGLYKAKVARVHCHACLFFANVVSLNLTATSYYL